MATKKQRRRREKLQRHEYEYVVETDEGTEVVVTPPRKKEPASGATQTGGKLVDARGRVIQPPSWKKALKRGAIFGPLMFVFIIFIGGKNVSLAAKLINAFVLVALFIPFTYFMDRVIYRQVQKRQQRAAGQRR